MGFSAFLISITDTDVRADRCVLAAWKSFPTIHLSARTAALVMLRTAKKLFTPSCPPHVKCVRCCVRAVEWASEHATANCRQFHSKHVRRDDCAALWIVVADTSCGTCAQGMRSQQQACGVYASRDERRQASTIYSSIFVSLHNLVCVLVYILTLLHSAVDLWKALFRLYDARWCAAIKILVHSSSQAAK